MSTLGPPSVELTGIHYNGTTLFAEWQANIGPGFEYFKWTVFDLDSPWKYEENTTNTRVVKELALSTNSAYQTYVEMYADGQVVASSTIEFVLTVPPAIDEMVYAIGSLQVDWPEVAQTGVFGYVVSIDATGTSHENFRVDTNSFQLDRVLDTQFIWTSAVSAKTFSGISTGPQSMARVVILFAPTLTGVSYDMIETAAAWAPLEQPGAEGFVATLIGGGSVENYETEDFTIAIPGVRDPQQTWTLSVAAQSGDGVVVGPSSQLVTLIVVAPPLDELDYDASQLVARWTKVPPPVAADGYLVQLRDPNEIQNFEAGDVNELTIPITLSLDITYQLWVLATNGIVAGPRSNRLTPLVKPATHARLDTDLTVQPLIANWTQPNGGETGFLVELYKNGTAQPGLSAMPPVTLPQTLEAGVAYQMRVRPTGDKVKGPWTTLVPGPWLANIVYGYDRMARLQSIAWNGMATRTWSYDDAGNILSVANTPAEAQE